MPIPDKDRIEQICRDTLGRIAADAADMTVSYGATDLTRFANNEIHQNVEQVVTRVDICVQRDGRLGRATTNQLDIEALNEAIARAQAACKVVEPDPDLPGPVEPLAIESNPAFDNAAAKLSPEAKAESVRQAAWAAKKFNLNAHGMYKNQQSLVAFANSRGQFAAHPATKVDFSVTVEGEDVSGWASTGGYRLEQLEIPAAIKQAVDGCRKAAKPAAVPAGKYTVVLPPNAAADFLYFMAYHVFNGMAFAEGRSPFADKLGQKLFHESFSVRDDTRHVLAPGLPFDYDGLPRQSVTLVENGVARSVAHDRRSAALCGAHSTGHALPQPNPYGPIPMNLVVDGGDATLDELIAGTERGLYVTHFHYTNVINPREQIITGMTRDGLFLIEDGKITRPVKNMRFTESAFNAYGNLTGLTRNQKAVGGGFGFDFVVPGMRIDNFSFTSSTEF